MHSHESVDYIVPVWFEIRGISKTSALLKIAKILEDLEKLDQLPNYQIGEPQEVFVNP
jgi:hypothetical protein